MYSYVDYILDIYCFMNLFKYNVYEKYFCVSDLCVLNCINVSYANI